jgi:hypothetical protein
LLRVAAVVVPFAGWEDGTLPFLSIASLKHGFAQLQALGGMQVGASLPVVIYVYKHKPTSV